MEDRFRSRKKEVHRPMFSTEHPCIGNLSANWSELISSNSKTMPVAEAAAFSPW